ncbi:hypothetical protein V4890_18425 [Ralstonia solanacearum species complex bacterium KE056]
MSEMEDWKRFTIFVSLLMLDFATVAVPAIRRYFQQWLPWPRVFMT